MVRVHESVNDLAGAILDGTPIDWQLADSGAGDTDRTLLEQLRVLAAIADVHRRPLEENTGLREWGPLRVLEPIGRGAFGEVYRAWDTRLDREVALKLLPSSSPADETRATTIIEEGRLLARVRHPNVATIYGAERIGDRVGLWMEFIDGQTLEQTIRDGRPFTEAEALGIGSQLCAAVAAVHQAGLLHRDIKAQNVMISSDGRVVLMDFGAGRELGDATGDGLTGTPLYLAPELLKGHPATVSSDVYACGVVLYYLLTGSFPICARTLPELRAGHERVERIPIAQRRSDLSAPCAAVIERALDPDSSQRYHSVSELRADLSRLAPDAGGAPRPRIVAMTALAAGLMLISVDSVARFSGRSSPLRSGLAAIGLMSPASAPAALANPVIAVLPFTNLSSEAGSDVFVAGLGVEVQSQLAAIDGLRVLSQLSSFSFKDRALDLPEIRRVLGANLVLAVTVRRSGDRLKVDPQLIQTADGAVIWADAFDRDQKDVFAIQESIALAIVNKLRLSLGRGQRRYNTDLATYDLYLKARWLVGFKDPGNALAAAALFQQVIDRDPNYAPAYAGLADANAFASQTYLATIPIDKAYATMRSASDRAIELDPLLAEAHAAKGLVQASEYEWRKSEESFERAISLNPSLTQSYTNFVLWTLMPLGRFDEALRGLETARRNDPLSLDVQRVAAMVHLFAGRFAESISAFEAVSSIDPELPFLKKDLGRALMFGGRVADAFAMYEGEKNPIPHYLAFAHVMAGNRSAAERLLNAHKGFPVRELGIYTALGDMDGAFDAIERALVSDPRRIALFLMSPEMAAVRADARYASVRRRLKLP